VTPRPEALDVCSVCLASSELSSVVYDTELWIATLALGIPGVVTLQTRRHSEGVWSLEPREGACLGNALVALSQALRTACHAQRVWILSFGEQVLHAHFLLVPRTSTIPIEASRVELFARAHEFVDLVEAARVGAALRDELLEQTLP
jgi:diadenosine tetraphosphate (Ap4A) HIT family hydrolase